LILLLRELQRERERAQRRFPLPSSSSSSSSLHHPIELKICEMSKKNYSNNFQETRKLEATVVLKILFRAIRSCTLS
jgi:hypothetical protein